VREAFDKMVEAKRQQDAKKQEMDKKRKADVDALEARERAAAKRKAGGGGGDDGYTSAVRNYESQLARMREQNKKFMQDIEDKRREENERQAQTLRQGPAKVVLRLPVHVLATRAAVPLTLTARLAGRSTVEGKIDEAQRQRDAHLELSRTVPGPGLPLRMHPAPPAPAPLVASAPRAQQRCRRQ